jgi:hypothetical protein
MAIAPQPLPAQACETRTQQELFSSSQWNFTLTRPYSSGPLPAVSATLSVTTAVCGPGTTDLAVIRAGRNSSSFRMAVKLQLDGGLA